MVILYLTQAQENADKTLELTTATGVKIFQTANEALALQFDGTVVNVYIFCEKLTYRAELAGWLQG